MSSRTPVAVAVVVVRGCRVAIFRRFVPNVFGSVCPRSASWCGSSHIRLPSGVAAAAARAVFFVGEVSSVFFWVLRFEVFAEPFDFAGEFVDFAEQFLLGDQPVGFFPAQGDVLLQYVVVFFAQQSIERCMSASMSLRRLRRLTSQVTAPAREAARQGIVSRSVISVGFISVVRVEWG